MKRAFFVMGPESSGTRLMTRILCQAGCYGQHGHAQKMDGAQYGGDFGSLPDTIVFRRSVPHARKWPDIGGLICQMSEEHYAVVAIVMVRDITATAWSQYRIGHVKSFDEAYENIMRAYQLIFEDVGFCTIPVIPVSYEAGILHREAVIGLLKHLELNSTLNLELRDENGKYYGST